jgi:protein TonB
MNQALPRYAGAASLATLVTFTLFFLMQWMVASGSFDLNDSKRLKVIDFVRLKRSEEVQEKQRELPRREAPERPPPPDVDLSDVPKPDAGALSMAATSFQPDLDLSGPGFGGAASDADVIPLVRVNPQYPSRALLAGVEGWVHLEFTVSAAGTVKDVEVLDADPRGYFEKSAEQAVLKYKYKPKIEDGTAVERTGVQIILSFKLNK